MLLEESLKFWAETSPIAGCVLMAVGGLKVAEHGLGVLCGLWKHALRPRRRLQSRYAKANVEPWAVISGG